MQSVTAEHGWRDLCQGWLDMSRLLRAAVSCNVLIIKWLGLSLVTPAVAPQHNCGPYAQASEPQLALTQINAEARMSFVMMDDSATDRSWHRSAK
jgi:hypothetical protein